MDKEILFPFLRLVAKKDLFKKMIKVNATLITVHLK